MRALHLLIDQEDVAAVLGTAQEHGAPAPVAVQAESAEAGAAKALVLLTLPNDQVGPFVEAVRREVRVVELVILPVGALALQPPLQKFESRVRDVSRLSTLELVIGSLQSVGAWRGMLLFSVLAGVIGAYGLIFDASYLLVAAMLINPMGAPALVAVVAVAIGDGHMFGRGALRFIVSLGVQAAAAAALGWAFDIRVSTAMMEQVTSLSGLAVVLALAAGAAGAQTQVKSDRDSLVSGTASGFMVAAALAPPAAVLGLSVPLARWDYAALMSFLLVLQFVAIAVGGWLALRVFGVRPGEPAVHRGTRRLRTTLLLGLGLAVAALIVLQHALAPRFQRADFSRTALGVARDAVDTVEDARFVASDARFTRASLDRYDSETMLMQIVVERWTDAARPDSLIAGEVRAATERLIMERMRDVLPFVDVTVLPAPGYRR